MLHHEYNALKGYRFLGGAISFYSVSCMSDVIFNPSLLNWSSLILTVAHMYINIYIYTYTVNTVPGLFFHCSLGVATFQRKKSTKTNSLPNGTVGLDGDVYPMGSQSVNKNHPHKQIQEKVGDGNSK